MLECPDRNLSEAQSIRGNQPFEWYCEGQTHAALQGQGTRRRTMPDENDFPVTEGHDPQVLAQASQILDACASVEDMGHAVLEAVERNQSWRGDQCVNLLAPEAPTSPAVRACCRPKWASGRPRATSGRANRWVPWQCATLMIPGSPRHVELLDSFMFGISPDFQLRRFVLAEATRRCFIGSRDSRPT